MKKNSILLCYLRIVFFLSFISFFINLSSAVKEDYKINLIQDEGYMLEGKPSISERLNGSKEVIVVKPNGSSIVEDLLSQGIYEYFENLGIPVTYHNVPIERTQQSSGRITTISGDPDLGLIEFVKHPNTLVVAASYRYGYGGMFTQLDATIYVFDVTGSNVWKFRIDDIDLDVMKQRIGKKFQKKLKQSISETYTYDPNFSVSPYNLKMDWDENKLRKYCEEKYNHPIEGIYDVNNEKYGVKINEETGDIYVFFLKGNRNSFELWQPGTIRAVFQPTATANLYKGSWGDRYMRYHDASILFEPGLFTIVEDQMEPVSYLKLYPSVETIAIENNPKWSGTGFALKNGYIVTNNHVAEDASDIEIFGVNGDFTKGYKAKVIGKDKVSDIAILKIEDPTIISSWTNPPYSVNFSMADVGEDVFALGYPLIGTMGEEVKLTNGIISSRSGFEGDVTNYQISVPIQPGNSGGPMFNEDGELAGIICAKHEGAENAGYAIKTSYLKNLIESIASSNIIPINNTLKGKALKDQVKSIRNNVFLIKCSK